MPPTTPASELRISKTLAEHVQNLPQELYDQILDITMTTAAARSSHGTRQIDRRYRPPVQLHVSRKLRLSFASKYYAHTDFVASTGRGPYQEQGMGLIRKWLESLPHEHRNMLNSNLRIYVDAHEELYLGSAVNDALKDIQSVHEEMMGGIVSWTWQELGRIVRIGALQRRDDHWYTMMWIPLDAQMRDIQRVLQTWGARWMG